METKGTEVIDEKVDVDHRQRTVAEDPKASAHQYVPDDPSMDQRTAISSGISSESGTSVEDATFVPSDGHSSLGLHSLNTSTEDLDVAQHPLEDESLRVSDTQINEDYTDSVEPRKTQDSLSMLPNELNRRVEVGSSMSTKIPETSEPSEYVHQVNTNRGLIDTAAPFESVKEAVNKFGGTVDWKAQKAHTLERCMHIQSEFKRIQAEIPEYKKQSEAAEDAKAQILRELDNTKTLIEELKLSLERAQTEEAQAKQDSELTQLRMKEVEQGITDESSVAAKQQLEVARARLEAETAELKSLKEELEALQGEYASLVNERDMAIRKVEDAISSSKETEKTVEDLTLKLIKTKEALDSAHRAHLEAEEHRIGAALAREQDCINWENELKQAEEGVQRLNEQILLVKDLKPKLDTASALLLNLKTELAAYMESKLNQESGSLDKTDDTEETMKTGTFTEAALASTKKELEEVKNIIEKAKDDVQCLRVAASSLKLNLDSEKSALITMRQREGMAYIAVSSLQEEINRTKQELKLVLTKEKYAREKMVELPKLLQQASQKSDQAKFVARLSREELRKAKEEAEFAKAGSSTVEIRLLAALKEIEAAKTSERLALSEVAALQESEQSIGLDGEDSPRGVTLPLEEYYILTKRAREAEQLAKERVTAAIAQIEVAKQSESKNLDKLKEANREMDEKKEALRIAADKAEKARDGKLGVEQELRKWRSQHEQQKRESDAAQNASDPWTSKTLEENAQRKSTDKVDDANHTTKIYMPEYNPENDVSEPKVKRKKSFFPRVVMFLARKKAQSLK